MSLFAEKNTRKQRLTSSNINGSCYKWLGSFPGTTYAIAEAYSKPPGDEDDAPHGNLYFSVQEKILIYQTGECLEW